VRALKPTIADSLESSARQLRYAMEQSGSLDEAFQKVYAAANAEQRIAVQQLELLLRSPESPESLNRHLRRSSYSTLAWLLHQTAAPEKSAAALLGEYRRQESFRATTLVALWSEFAGFLAYLGAVLAVLIVVVSLYAALILPQFRSLYRGFGTDLPTLTSVVFGGGAPVFTLLMLLAVGLLFLVSWFVFLLRRRLKRYVPISARYQRIPLIGPVALAYHQCGCRTRACFGPREWGPRRRSRWRRRACRWFRVGAGAIRSRPRMKIPSPMGWRLWRICRWPSVSASSMKKPHFSRKRL
jgi:hypothetical protein